MRSPRTRRCVVPLCTALVFTGLALHCSGVSARARAKVNERLDARPGSVRIDLSRPGAGTATVPELVRAHHHGIGYVLDLGAGPPVDADALRGLLGTIRVTDAHGNTVEEARFDDGLKFGDIGPNQALLKEAHQPQTNEYQLRVTIESGAPALAGREATVSGRYWICELELLPAMFWGLLMWLAAFAAGIGWLVTLVRLAKRSGCTVDAVAPLASATTQNLP